MRYLKCVSWCEDCVYTEVSDFRARAFSNAEWHNVSTGHDVAVDCEADARADAQESYRLTAIGWQEV